MNFVLDTNAVSETRKPRPDSGLLNWLSAQDPAHLFITTVTIAEGWNRFHSLPPKHPDYESIKAFASGLPRKYPVLNFDARAAAMWGELAAHATGPLLQVRGWRQTQCFKATPGALWSVPKNRQRSA